MNQFEKLGAFYLGKNYDLLSNSIKDEIVLYDSKDLTTHAICVGMTGSGKTGLCIDLLEEAAIDNIPSIIIDPKGDITNLMLTFPELKGENFLPWINKSDAKRKEMSEKEFAESQAQLWKKGLKEWGQDESRIQMLKNSAEFNIYTPGSNAGLSISILDSFKAPPQEIIEDNDIFSDKISSTVSSLLGLLGIDADPLKSKEHILLSNILQHFWLNGENLDLPKIIENVQNPPFNKIGVFNIDSFYKEDARFALAMQLNNILSAPGFQSWLEGEPLDIDKILYSEQGKPRVSIFYTAHLSDSERMFFTSLLLNQVLSWMRMQSGTTSLRALLYIDEIFGYLPPVANPPSKKPFLTLLKQARAFGLGLVLATQNPADLDYKSLSNAGTWFLGRLQTERDRKRVLDGLEGASSEGNDFFDRNELDKLLSNLDKRVFLLHNVHEDNPVVFYTRWAMSYLRGPLTRTQIKSLTKPAKKEYKKLKPLLNPTETIVSAPSISNKIKQLFLLRAINEPDNFLYKPYIIAITSLRFYNRSKKVDVNKNAGFLVPITNDIISVKWSETSEIVPNENIFSKKSDNAIKYSEMPKAGTNEKNYSKWEDLFEDYISSEYYLELYHNSEFKLTSELNEGIRDFKIRLTQISREKRDQDISKIKNKYSRKVDIINRRIKKVKDKIETEKEQSKQQKFSTAISIGSTILGALFGSRRSTKSTINKAGTAFKSAGKIFKESNDVDRAEENLIILEKQLEEVQNQLEDELLALDEKYNSSIEQIEILKIRPTKSSISLKVFNLLWIPLAEEGLNDINEIELV
ncbi:MAG: ATP-binding protein [Ignavibacteriae bacterium]|nr:MAG: ATP-binding protein [Ignavibacteriota bacterium]